MMAKADLLDLFVQKVGRDLVSIVDRLDGWPSIVRINLLGESLLVALHIDVVQGTFRGRDHIERRIQNPAKGRSLSAPPGTYPLIVGVWTERGDNIFVGMDARLRMSRTTRQSMFVRLQALENAANFGWDEYVNRAGELIVTFRPVLLPAYVEMRQSGLRLFSDKVGRAFEASGLLSPESQQRGKRERRVSIALARSAKFSRAVIAAYGGSCAMCGLGLGLVEGAHIYPVMAPDSPDEVWNGLALCGNHHGAFDRHLIWVNPSSLVIKMHPVLLGGAGRNYAAQSFLRTTYSKLQKPSSLKDCPLREMFKARYKFFSGAYSWASRKTKS